MNTNNVKKILGVFILKLENKQGLRIVPNPPPKVLYSSDYGLQRSAVGSHSTVSPNCSCGFDQNDRADINPQPSPGRDLSYSPRSPHGNPSPVFPVHLNPVILVKTVTPLHHRFFIPMKPTLLSLHGSEPATQSKHDPWPISQTLAAIAPSPCPAR